MSTRLFWTPFLNTWTPIGVPHCTQVFQCPRLVRQLAYHTVHGFFRIVHILLNYLWRVCTVCQNPSPGFPWLDFDGFSTPQYSPANTACSHVYQIHQTPPMTAFVGFRTVYIQAMNTCLAFATVPIPSNFITNFYCMLMDFSSQNALGVRVTFWCLFYEKLKRVNVMFVLTLKYYSFRIIKAIE